MYALVLLRNNIIVLNERVVSPGHSVLTGMGNVVFPVQSPGCCSTWTFCQDRNGRDLSFGSWFLSCPDRSSHSLAEVLISFFFKYHLILLIKYFLLVHDNINYFTCIFSRLILVGIREPKSTRWLADE